MGLNPRQFQILCLSGGGYLGLFSAEILALAEERFGEPLGRHFDLIAGTSVGGILALGLAFEVPASAMRDAFNTSGQKIFSGRPKPQGRFAARRDLLRYLIGPKYSAGPLRELVGGFLGKDTRLGQAKHRVIIPAVNMTKGGPQVFKTPHHPDFRSDYKLSAVDIAMATSAAPTLFPLAEIQNSLYADGGLFAAAPDRICGA